MTNNLRKISQDLRAFAKKTKEFKYSDSALITFLISGTLSVANNLLAAGESGVQNQRQAIFRIDSTNGTRRPCCKISMEQLG